MIASAVPPCLILAAINAYNLWEEHWEHWAHEPPLEERTEYPYQNIRVKNFPFGDGDKVSSPSVLVIACLLLTQLLLDYLVSSPWFDPGRYRISQPQLVCHLRRQDHTI